MKKQIIIATLALGAFVFGTNNAQAQTVMTPGTPSNPVSTTVNIILSDVISIDAGAAVDGIVNFNYTTAAHYNAPMNVTVPNSLIVTSSRNFNVNVIAVDENFLNPNHADFIPLNVLQVKAVPGGTDALTGTRNDITLSMTPSILVANATKGAQKSLSIDYSISAVKAQTELLGKEPGTYTAKVKYTATSL